LFNEAEKQRRTDLDRSRMKMWPNQSGAGIGLAAKQWPMDARIVERSFDGSCDSIERIGLKRSQVANVFVDHCFGAMAGLSLDGPAGTPARAALVTKPARRL